MANAPAGSNTRKIADFYHSYMDEATIEAKGLAPTLADSADFFSVYVLRHRGRRR
jgi:predicted metalloendopeptidase